MAEANEFVKSIMKWVNGFFSPPFPFGFGAGNRPLSPNPTSMSVFFQRTRMSTGLRRTRVKSCLLVCLNLGGGPGGGGGWAPPPLSPPCSNYRCRPAQRGCLAAEVWVSAGAGKKPFQGARGLLDGLYLLFVLHLLIIPLPLSPPPHSASWALVGFWDFMTLYSLECLESRLRFRGAGQV